MKTHGVVTTTLVLLILTACGGSEERPPAEADAPAADTAAVSVVVPEWVAPVAAVANAIEARPAAADSILAANGMTREEFESRLFEIAADPMLTEAYEGARAR